MGKRQAQLGEEKLHQFNLNTTTTTTNLPIKAEQDSEKYNHILKTSSLHPSILNRLSFAPNFSALGNGSCGQFITHCFCRSFLLRGRTRHTLPLLQCGVPPTGDTPPSTSWVPSPGCSPSGTGCSSVGPPRGHKSCQQTCSSVGSSLHGATGPARSLLQHGLPTGSQPPSGTSPCSGVGSSPGLEEAEQPSDIEEGGLDLSVSLKPVSFYIADKKEMLQQCFCVIGEKKLQKMLPDILKVLKYTYCLYTFYKLECLCNKARLSLKFSGLPSLTGLEHTLFESCEWQDLVKVNWASSLYRRRGCR
uniref:Uncharacterized protein n=1 Tax=Bubo bubo TaxID=30461 RepID=A0A8C0F7B9_BUBBB